MVFKNTKWPTCVYMIKNITQTVVIYFNRATKAEDRIVAMILSLVRSTCYLSPRVRNTCTEIWELSGYNYSHFFRWITALRALRPSKKSLRSSLPRVYCHELELQGQWQTILFCMILYYCLEINLKLK